MLRSRSRLAFPSVIIVQSFFLCANVLAANDYIDFETLPGGTPTTDGMVIHDQYSNPPPPATYTGVTFFLSDDGFNPNGEYPRLAKVGCPMTAFQGPELTAPSCDVTTITYCDMPRLVDQALVGCTFLTDDDEVNPDPPSLVVVYDDIVTMASGRLLDIDAAESWQISAYNGVTPVGQPIVLSSAQGWNDGEAALWSFVIPGGFDRIAITYIGGPQNVGLAFDMFYTDFIECVDMDGDGYGDPSYPNNPCEPDNCPNVFNLDQADTDGDGIGDACDCQCDWTLPGDVNCDGNVNPVDVVFMVNKVYLNIDMLCDPCAE